ncbi:hypothetical protein [Salana multivorans]
MGERLRVGGCGRVGERAGGHQDLRYRLVLRFGTLGRDGTGQGSVGDERTNDASADRHDDLTVPDGIARGGHLLDDA